MPRLTLSIAFACIITIASVSFADKAKKNDGWISLFDGKTLNGWKASENKDSCSVEDGKLKIGGGPRSHLFYVGKVNGGKFKNFEFKCQVMTKPKANSGIYFHTEYQETGWPSKGYECQVNNTHRDRRKTASLYAIKDVLDTPPAKDNEWFDYHIKVKGKTITISINGKKITEYTEPADGSGNKSNFKGRKLSEGTFAFQAHDPGSVVYYREVYVKPLK